MRRPQRACLLSDMCLVYTAGTAVACGRGGGGKTK